MPRALEDLPRQMISSGARVCVRLDHRRSWRQGALVISFSDPTLDVAGNLFQRLGTALLVVGDVVRFSLAFVPSIRALEPKTASGKTFPYSGMPALRKPAKKCSRVAGFLRCSILANHEIVPCGCSRRRSAVSTRASVSLPRWAYAAARYARS